MFKKQYFCPAKNPFYENSDYSNAFNVGSGIDYSINKEITVEEGLKQIDKLSLPIEDGFSYSDTVHVKEKIVQCERQNCYLQREIQRD